MRIVRYAILVLCGLLVAPLSAADPPALRLVIGLQDRLQSRYSEAIDEANGLDAFHEKLARDVVASIQSRGYWLAFCWPLEGGTSNGAVNVLDVQLELLADNWRMNVTLKPQGKQPVLVMEKDGVREPVEFRATNGGSAAKLPGNVADCLVKHVLQPDKVEQLHKLVRGAIPVGSGIAKPDAGLPPEFGIIQVDHLLLRDPSLTFRFDAQVPIAPGVNVVKTYASKGTGGQFTFGPPGMPPASCILIQFLDMPPPAAGQIGDVFINAPAGSGSTALPIFQ